MPLETKLRLLWPVLQTVLYSVVPIIVRRFLMHFGFGMHSQMRLIP